MHAVLLGAALAAMLLLAPLAPRPTTVTGFRVSAYASHLAWFATLLLLAAMLTHAWAARLRVLVAAVAALFVAVVALNLLDVDVASDLAKVAFGALAGIAFVRAIERPWWLLPVCVLVPVADAWSVFSERGVTNQVVDRAREDPAWIQWPTIATPIAGYPYESFGRIGTVDVFFAALFLAAARRWRLGVRRCVVALAIGFLATSVLVFEGADIAVPALPMLCVAFVAACVPALWRDLRADWASRT